MAMPFPMNAKMEHTLLSKPPFLVLLEFLLAAKLLHYGIARCVRNAGDDGIIRAKLKPIQFLLRRSRCLWGIVHDERLALARIAPLHYDIEDIAVVFEAEA
jgi:hypothetical protein